MKTTTNYSLKKPELNDYVNVNDLNDNADKIDTELKKISDAIGNLPDLNTNEKTALVLSINELLTKIGNTSSLTTDKKNNLVDALNELKQHLTAHLADFTQHVEDNTKHITAQERANWNQAVTDIGTKSNLLTTNKTDLVSAINEVFTNGNNVKADTVGALLSVDDSLPITENDSWQNIINAIGQISTGKKWAAGNTPAVNGRLVVNGLAFRPKFIFIQYGGAISDPQMRMFAYTDGTIVPIMLGRKAWMAEYSDGMVNIESWFTINDDGFILYGVTNFVWGNLDWLALD